MTISNVEFRMSNVKIRKPQFEISKFAMVS
jgi:hypothetical protein